MRTDSKYKIIGALVGAGIGAAGVTAYQKYKLEQKGLSLTVDNINGWQLFLWSILGGIAGVFAGESTYKLNAALKTDPHFRPSEFLNNLLKDQSLKSDPARLGLVLKYKQLIKDKLNNVYHSRLADLTQDAGSFHNQTAIAAGYDVDIIVPFKKKAFSSLSLMHEDVYEVLASAFAKSAEVIKNKKTVAIKFKDLGYDIDFDIVPGREINCYKKDGKLNTTVTPDFPWEDNSSQKINVTMQQRVGSSSEQVRAVIRLIKLYVKRNNLDIPGVIIEQVVVTMFEKNTLGKGNSRECYLLNAMNALIINLGRKFIIDKSNSNNNLLTKVSDASVVNAIELMTADVLKVGANVEYLKEIFKD